MTATLRTMDYAVLQQCMHCGMCLPTCPTYDATRRERNSPRGRIALMRAVADGDLEVTREFAEEMSYCLGCLACQTACPGGRQLRRAVRDGAERHRDPGRPPRRRAEVLARGDAAASCSCIRARFAPPGWLLRVYQRTGARGPGAAIRSAPAAAAGAAPARAAGAAHGAGVLERAHRRARGARRPGPLSCRAPHRLHSGPRVLRT